ncbi:hypothetical protein FKP32DRAFT_941267 [Trametes sanguinea]|nr:hypothetical protein FKP32DRAFT_941267 [Trametes sanguinea]
MSFTIIHPPPVSRVRAVTTEGSHIETVGRPIEASTVASGPGARDNLRELTIESMPFTQVPAISELLRQGMSHLEQLRVELRTLETGHDTRPLPTFELPPAKYPALRSIALENSASLIAPSLASHLWRLDMRSGPGFTHRLPLAPFLDCISSFKCLEELVLSNCFSPPADGHRHTPRSILAKSRIIELSLEDHPATVSQILSSMILPSNGKVRLIGDLRGISSPRKCFAAFTAMFPNDRRHLPILQRLARVDVYHAPEACYIMAKSESEDLFDLEHITDALHNPSFKPLRGELFELMVHGIRDIFPDSPIERLSFAGDVGYVPRATWIACLSQFPRLHELVVDDIDLRASPEEVIAALHTTTTISATSDPRPICSVLESLELFGDLPSFKFLETIHKCLAWRKEQVSKAPLLRNLRLSLYSDTAVPNMLLTRYTGELYKLADKRRIEVIVQMKARSRYA